MSDLLFAAAAAEDAEASLMIAEVQKCRQDDLSEMEDREFETVDDLEVAALAASAANWDTFEEPIPALRKRKAVPLRDEAEIELDSEESCCSSVSDQEEVSQMMQIESATDVTVAFEIEQDGMADAHEEIKLVLQYHAPPISKAGHQAEAEISRSKSSAHSCEAELESEDVVMENAEVEEVQLIEGDQLKIVGTVQNRVGCQIVVQAEALVRPLDAGSILFTLDGTSIGKVADIFGCVENPFYVVDARRDDCEIAPGTKVYSTDRLSVYIDLPSKDAPKNMSDSESDMSDDASEDQQSGDRGQCQTTTLIRSQLRPGTQQRRVRSRNVRQRRSTTARRQYWQRMEQTQRPALPLQQSQWGPQPSQLVGAAQQGMMPQAAVMAPMNAIWTPLAGPNFQFQAVQPIPQFVGFHPYNAMPVVVQPQQVPHGNVQPVQMPQSQLTQPAFTAFNPPTSFPDSSNL